MRGAWLLCVLFVLRNLFSRSSVQVAARNFGWLAADKLVRLVFGVGVGFWIARYLGPEQLGVLSYSTAIVVLLGFLPAFGLDAIVKRDLLQRSGETAELLGSGAALRFGAGVIAYGGVLLVAWSGEGAGSEEPQLLPILGLLLFQPALMVPDLWLQANLRASWSVCVQMMALVMCSVLRVWLICSGGTLVDFALVLVLETALGAAGVWVATRHLGLRFHLSAARLATIKRLLAEAWPLMFVSLAIVVYMRIDELMLRHMAGAAEVGIYSAATRLSEVWYFLPMVVGSSVLPALLRARERGAQAYAERMQHYYDASAAAAYLLSVPVALLAPWVVRMAYGEAFAKAGAILAVHIWSSIFVFLGVARGQWLVNEKLPRFYLATTMAGAIVNILLNWLLIPRWGGLGAAYATVAAYGLAAWVGSFCHSTVRATAMMQTRALLIPLLGWRYLRHR